VTHKIVSAVVGLVVVLFAGAALLFAWCVSARAPEPKAAAPAPAIPHAVDASTADCGTCHQTGSGTLPVTHRAFPAGACAGCHPAERAVRIPHSVSMGDARCVLCHGESDEPLAMPASHRGFEDVRCAFCHPQDAGRATLQPPAAGESAKKAPAIRHPVKGLFEDCLSCHEIGGRPSMPESHRAFGGDTCRFVCHFRPAGR
jgi:hypothetical protein